MINTLQLTLWQVLLIVGAFLTLLTGFGKILLASFKEHLDGRFELMESHRRSATSEWTALHDRLRDEIARVTAETARLEHDLVGLRMILVEDYIKRQDAEHLVERVVARLDRLSEELRAIDRARHGPPNPAA